ncbi:MAG: PrsW family glutamic-type intramembrane protease [bacterium]
MSVAFITSLAFLGGVVPALLWMLFWIFEDRCDPEPKRYIFLSFVAGMVAVLLVYRLEQLAQDYTSGILLLTLWATLEELFKFGAAYFVALRTTVFDEPLDAVIYLVTAALGFSALENALFLWTPLHEGGLLRTVVTGDLRFMGATLLHTLASATIGIMIALSFYKKASVRRLFAFIGVILAIFLHTLFNFFILNGGSNNTMWVFVCIWLGIVALLLMTERIKQPRDYC